MLNDASSRAEATAHRAPSDAGGVAQALRQDRQEIPEVSFLNPSLRPMEPMGAGLGDARKSFPGMLGPISADSLPRWKQSSWHTCMLPLIPHGIDLTEHGFTKDPEVQGTPFKFYALTTVEPQGGKLQPGSLIQGKHGSLDEVISYASSTSLKNSGMTIGIAENTDSPWCYRTSTLMAICEGTRYELIHGKTEPNNKTIERTHTSHES